VLPIRETHPLQGQSPYSASKIAADKLCEAYHYSFNVPVVTLRPFNTYGPRQSTRAVLPTILVQLLAGKEEVKLGRLDPKRDLTFVADTVEGFVKAAEVEGIEGEVIQLGTGRTVSINELFDAACAALAAKARVVQEQERLRPDNSEVMVLLSDPSKAKSVLGWEALVPLEEGLRRTAGWLERHLHLYDPERYHR
jgi:UDP-glucose 4-epimerase